MTASLCSLCIAFLLPCAFLPPACLQYLSFAPIVQPVKRRLLLTGYALTWLGEFSLSLYLIYVKQADYLLLYHQAYHMAWLPYLLIAMACIRPYFFRHLFLFLIRSIFVMFFLTFCFFIVYGLLAPYIPKLAGDWRYVMTMFLYIALYSLLLPALSRFFYKTFFTYSDIGTPKIWAYACLLPALLLGNNLFFISGQFALPLYSQYLLARTISALAALLFVLTIRAALQQLHFSMLTQQRQQALSTQIQNVHTYIEDMQSSQRELHTFFQKRQYHLQKLIQLIQENKISQAFTVIQHLNHRLNLTKRKRYCEDPILNASLLSYLDLAEKQGIPLTVRVELPKVTLSMNTDLAMVIANLLENAIHASEKQPVGQRSLSLILMTQGDMLNLLVKNRFDGKIECDDEGFPITHRHGHGIGMQSLLAFRDRYHATVLCTHKDGYFTTYLRVSYQ